MKGFRLKARLCTLALALCLCCQSALARDRAARGIAFAPAATSAPNVLSEASRWLGSANPTGTVGPWCADFASFVLRRTGRKGLPGRMALDALRAGARQARPEAGDLAVMRSHVTFFVGFDGSGGFLGLGGNQGRRVSVARFALSSVLAWVRPSSW